MKKFNSAPSIGLLMYDSPTQKSNGVADQTSTLKITNAPINSNKTERETCQTVAPITIAVNEVREVQVQLPHGDVDVVRVHAEPGLRALRVLLEPLPVRALQGNGFEQYHHHQV